MSTIPYDGRHDGRVDSAEGCEATRHGFKSGENCDGDGSEWRRVQVEFGKEDWSWL
jgi:hypothetical protein